MKKVLLLFFISLGIIPLYAQEIVSTLFKTEIIKEISGSKATIYSNACLWFTTTDGTIKKDVTFQDKESGIIQGSIEFDISSGNYIKAKEKCNLRIDCKDNKYRLTFTELNYSSRPNVQDLDNMSSKSLELAIKENEAVVEISKKLFNNSTTWNVPLLEVNLLGQEQKGYKIFKTKESVDLARKIINNSKQRINEISKQIEKAISSSSDF